MPPKGGAFGCSIFDSGEVRVRGSDGAATDV